MKKRIIVSALIILAASIFAANATTVKNLYSVKNCASVLAAPPPIVLASFRSIFGSVPVRQWKLRSNGYWRAHFMRNGIAWEATFTPSGMLVKSEPA